MALPKALGPLPKDMAPFTPDTYYGKGNTASNPRKLMRVGSNQVKALRGPETALPRRNGHMGRVRPRSRVDKLMRSLPTRLVDDTCQNSP